MRRKTTRWGAWALAAAIVLAAAGGCAPTGGARTLGKDQPSQRAVDHVTRYFKAQTLSEEGYARRDAASLREAIDLYLSVMRETSRDEMPGFWGMYRCELGLALFRLGELTGDNAGITAAVTALRVGLQEYTRERAPVGWADAQGHLGAALARLGNLNGDVGQLTEAVAALRLALTVQTFEERPKQWAATQNNLGNALASLGNHANDRRASRESIDAFDAALRVYNRDQDPLRWAEIQHNRGIALFHLAKDDDTDAGWRGLDAAIVAFRAALEERTREASPPAGAETTTLLGTTQNPARDQNPRRRDGERGLAIVHRRAHGPGRRTEADRPRRVVRRAHCHRPRAGGPAGRGHDAGMNGQAFHNPTPEQRTKRKEKKPAAKRRGAFRRWTPLMALLMYRCHERIRQP